MRSSREGWWLSRTGIRADAGCSVAEGRRRPWRRRARQPRPALILVVPALRLPAALERTIDDGPEQSVVVPPLDQEGDPHRAVLAALTAAQAPSIASATRPPPRPS